MPHQRLHLLERLLLNGLLLHASLLKCLLLETGLELVLVLHGLSLHLLLSGHRVFVHRPPLLAHLFFLCQFLLISLQLKLYLVLGLPLAHFYFKLLSLAAFFLSDLHFLDCQLSSNSRFVGLTLCFPYVRGALSLLFSWPVRKQSLRCHSDLGTSQPINKLVVVALTAAAFSSPLESKP